MSIKFLVLGGGVFWVLGGGGSADFIFMGARIFPFFAKDFLRDVMRAIWSVRPKCSHRCVSLKETLLKPVQCLKHATKNSAKKTVMRTKWFKHIAI